MKYLLSGLLAALFIAVPAIAENNKDTDKRPVPDEKQKRRKNVKRPAEQWRIMQEISEEERNRLRKLYDSDPQAFRQELAKIVSQLLAKEKEQDQTIKSLVQKYKTTEDPDEKQKAYEELRELTRKVFMDKMQKNKKRLESLETHVKKLRSQYEFRNKNAEKIIQARLDALIGNMDFEW